MMDMILECKVSEDSYDENRMDILFGELEQRNPHHPAVLQYRSFKLGSAKPLSSIMVTAVSNLHMLQSAAFAEMIATDEMFLPMLGVSIRNPWKIWTSLPPYRSGRRNRTASLPASVKK